MHALSSEKGSSWRSAVLLALVAALGCQGTYYDEHRSAHPGWEAPDVPIEGMDLEEVLAFVHAPDGIEGIAVSVTDLEIHDGSVNPWRRIDLDALRSGEEAVRDATTYAVISRKVCATEGGLNRRDLARVAWYLLPDGRLGAWDHYGFRSDCAVSNRFQAARGEAIPQEAAVLDHVLESYGKTTLSLDQLYRRGLAYVAAGRLLEARAALETAEPAYRAAAVRAARDPQGRAALAEVARLRASLMQALGLEVKPPDS